MNQKRKDYYNLKNSDPQFWTDKANDSWESSKSFVAPINGYFQSQLEGEEAESSFRPGMIDIYFMLVGFSFECLLKGLLANAILTNRNKAAFDSEKLDNELKEHKLLVLVDKLGLQFSQRERRTLEEITECLIWAGRYPTPTVLKRFKTRIIGQAEMHHAKAIYSKLQNEIIKI